MHVWDLKLKLVWQRGILRELNFRSTIRQIPYDAPDIGAALVG
jgi:hypothetical protein